MLPPQLQTLIRHFTKLPGIGPRQATRFVFYLLRNAKEASSLIDALQATKENITMCGNCFLPAQHPNLPGTVPGKLLCQICLNPKRDENAICVVEKETDALNLEKTGQFQGHYYILGGFIDPLEKESIANERLGALFKKLQNHSSAVPYTHDREYMVQNNFNGNIELILALAPRREGDFTSLYIEEQLKPLKERGLKIKTTRLGRGLSSGAELEYADEDTLKNALEGRR